MTICELIPEDQYALMRGVSSRTIQRERSLRTGPAFIRLGRKIYYRKAAIEAWLIAQEQVQPRAKGAGQ